MTRPRLFTTERQGAIRVAGLGAFASTTSCAVMYRLSPLLLVLFLAIYAVARSREKKAGAPA